PLGLHAQQFPTKPVNLTTPFGPGGATDLTARMFIGKAKQYLGQPIVFHLKPGGGGVIGSEEVYKAKPDGYSLLFAHTNTNSIYPATHPDDAKTTGPEGFEPVCRINVNYGFFLAAPDAPYNTLKEMVAWAKANPGKLVFGSTAAWSSNDIAWKELTAKTGMQTRVVFLTAGSQPMISILGGHVDVVRQAAAQSLAQVKAKKVKALSWSGSKRHRDMPNVPTEAGEGYPSPSSGAWKGIAAPLGTPRPVIDKLAVAFKKMTDDKDARRLIDKTGDEFNWLGPDEFKDYWWKDYNNFKAITKQYMVKK
ncbi:MAG: tripartite tricarboxylate transporter substrate binding protein, partial [Lentisphaerota bacterium]